MRSFVYQLVQRLADPNARLSRNRQFALLSSPAGARARRLFRHLRSLAASAAHPEARLVVEPAGEQWRIRIDLPPRLVREAMLSRDDVKVLARNPEGFEPALREALLAAGAIP